MALAKVRALHPDFFSDEAVAEVSIPARLLFAGLWCFACDNGHLADKPKQIKRWIYATDDVNAADLLRELEGENLIERGDGWIFIPRLMKRQRIDHRYFKACEKSGCTKPGKPDSQPETRSGNAVATQSPAVATRGPATDGDGVVDGDVTTTSATAAAVTLRDDVERLCHRLAASIENNGVKRPTINKAWRDAARLLMDKDGHTEQQVAWVIDWATSDDFWRTNILSMPKLREKFDQLVLKARGSNVHQLRTDDQGHPVLPPLPSRSPWGQS